MFVLGFLAWYEVLIHIIVTCKHDSIVLVLGLTIRASASVCGVSSAGCKV